MRQLFIERSLGVDKLRIRDLSQRCCVPSNDGTYSCLLLRVKGSQSDESPVSLEIPGRYLIGSEANAVVRLPLAARVSPRHAILLLESTSLRICDLDSSSGTYLNGQKIVAAELKDGDRIRCGTVTITVSLLQHGPLTQTLMPAAVSVASAAAEHERARPVQTFNPEIPDELARIVDFGISRPHELRYASAASLRAALEVLPLLKTSQR